MGKPNSQSVTTVQCACGHLERGANDPDSPIGFDANVNEHHYAYKFRGQDSQLMIYHCPWCGGVASESHRASLFHEFDREFCDQITEKTDSLCTLDDIIAELGKPDDDQFTSIKHNEQPSAAPRIERLRRLTFHKLSPKMSVSFIQQQDGTICPSFTPKPIAMTG